MLPAHYSLCPCLKKNADGEIQLSGIGICSKKTEVHKYLHVTEVKLYVVVKKKSDFSVSK